MSKMYRIYTENLNKDDIRQLVLARFNSCTMIDAEGVWEGQKEYSLIIELLVTVPVDCSETVKQLAKVIKEVNHQQAVLVTCQTVEDCLV